MGLLGDFLSGKRSEDESKKNREFQERMSNTSYQRGMEDMRLAGLNPILAYKMGGASSPTGSMAIHPSTGDAMGSALKAASTASGIKGNRATRKLQSAQTTATQVAKARNITGMRVDIQTAANLAEETEHIRAKTRGAAASASIQESQAVRAAMEAGYLQTGVGRANFHIMKWAQPALSALGIGVGAGVTGRFLKGADRYKKGINDPRGMGRRNARNLRRN